MVGLDAYARSHIQGDVYFCKTQPGRVGEENFVTDGLIFLNSVQIGADLVVAFEINIKNLKVKENGLRAHNCIVGGWITFSNMTTNNETVIDLSGTTSIGLNHNWNTFLPKGSIKELAIIGFVYDKYEYELHDHKSEWLSLLNKDSLGCYKQLAIVLIKNGCKQEAEDILIEMEEKKMLQLIAMKKENFFQSSKFKKIISWTPWIFLLVFSWAFKNGTGFGYRPLRALIAACFFIVFSGFIFQQGYKQKAFYPSMVEASQRQDCINSGKLPFGYISFYPFIFSVEEFFPVINMDLGVKKYWEINDKADLFIGSVKIPSVSLEYYNWFHKVAGWIISSLIVSGFAAYFIRKSN